MRILARPQVASVWDEFVDRSDEAWLWHRSEYEDALATWPERSSAGFAVVEGDDLLAVVPLHVVEAKLRRVLTIRYLDSMGGPALRNDLAPRVRRRVLEEVTTELRRLASEHGAERIELALSPLAPAYRGKSGPRVNPLLQLGATNTLTQTWLVDLQGGSEAVWARWAGNARTAVRKAEKSGITVRPATASDSDCQHYHRLHLATYNRTGVRPHPYAYFEIIWRTFLTQDLCRIWFAENEDGDVVAAGNFATYKNAAWYWTGAGDERALGSGANNLVQWAAVQDMIANGIDWYETGEAYFEGDDDKLRHLSAFKASMGGELYPLYRGVIASRGTAHRILRAARELRT